MHNSTGLHLLHDTHHLESTWPLDLEQYVWECAVITNNPKYVSCGRGALLSETSCNFHNACRKSSKRNKHTSLIFLDGKLLPSQIGLNAGLISFTNRRLASWALHDARQRLQPQNRIGPLGISNFECVSAKAPLEDTQALPAHVSNS